MNSENFDITNRTDFFGMLLDNLSDGIYFVDRNLKIGYWSKGAERILGLSRDQTIGFSCSDQLHLHVDDQGVPLCIDRCPVEAAILSGQFREGTGYLQHASGQRIPVTIRTSPIFDKAGEIVGALEVFSDASSSPIANRQGQEVKSEEAQDTLTGIGNRQYITSMIHTCLIESQRNQLSSGIGKRLVIPSRSVAPDFKVLLLPYKDQKNIPVTRWNKDRNRLTIQWPDQVEEFTFDKLSSGRTTLRLERTVAAPGMETLEPFVLEATE